MVGSHLEILRLCQWLPECWQLLEQLICSIFSSSIAPTMRVHQWASITIANIPSHESCFTAVNSSYVQWIAAATSDWGSGWGALFSACLHSPSSWADGHLSQKHSLRESMMSLQRCSLVDSSFLPLLGSLWSWYTSQYKSPMSFQMESGQMSSMVVGSTPQVLFRQGFSLALAGGTVMFAPASCGGMGEHLLTEIFLVKSTGHPSPLFLKVGIGVQPSFCLPYWNISLFC